MNLNKALFRFIKIAFSVLVLLIIVYAAGKLATTAYSFGYRVFTETAIDEAPGTDVLVQIKDGMSGDEMGQMLEEKGLVRDGKLFALQYRLSAYYKEIKPGVYTLNTSQLPKEMIMTMCPESEEVDGTEASTQEQ